MHKEISEKTTMKFLKRFQEEFLLNIPEKFLRKPLLEFIEMFIENYLWKFLEKPFNENRGGFSQRDPGAICRRISKEIPAGITGEMSC